MLIGAASLLAWGCEQKAKPTHLGPAAWNKQQWAEKTKGIRTRLRRLSGSTLAARRIPAPAHKG
ncbi:MAG: hypothetical protein DYG95_21505 [Chlorobi bacterium CHB1]|nr:hypothetical protein [Chlorobi bacterium CHB1]